MYWSGSLYICPLLCQQVKTFHLASLLNKPVEEYNCIYIYKVLLGGFDYFICLG
jgi:hypothetical protein